MGNITKYEEFLFEADSIDTQISATKQEMSKATDEYNALKTKYDDELVAAGKDPLKKLQAESTYLAGQAQSYGKMIPIINKLKGQIDQKAASLKA
jgi:hypothetical protein